jgi:hypothetical protein
MASVQSVANPVRIPSGRERRRKGLVNVLRRACYGVMLWFTQQQAMAADRATMEAQTPKQLTTLSRLSISLPATLSASSGWLLRQPEIEWVPPLRMKVGNTWREVRRLKDGLGLDLGVQDYGSLHLALHPKRDQIKPGTRLNLGSTDPTLPATQPLWSLGGAVDLVKYSESQNPAERSQRVHCAPQLLLDADRLTGLPGDGVMTVQHAYWQSSRYIPDQPVWQVRLRWRF